MGAKASTRQPGRKRKRVEVSIGVFSGTTPFDLRGEEHANPVLSPKDVTDVPAQIVADPAAAIVTACSLP